HPPCEWSKRGGRGRQRPRRLIALDSEPVLEARQKPVIVLESARVGMREQSKFVERAEKPDRVADAQLATTMPIAQRHHLREKFHVHQPAVALLDIEPRFVLGADFVF